MEWPDSPADEAAPVHELIGLIYDAAEDPDLWPSLLAGLAAGLEAEGEAPPPAVERRDGNVMSLLQRLDGDALTETLLPHFRRALRLNRRLSETRQDHERVLGILEHLPLGVILADESAGIRAMNGRARDLLAADGPLRLRNERLVAASLPDTIALQDLVRTAVVNADGGGILPLEGEPGVSLMIFSCQDETGPASPERCCTIFVAAPDLVAPLDDGLLTELYGLSRAEARLARLLAGGRSIEEAATELHISPHTARTQLKAVFGKTGTRRQPDLIRKLLTGPAILRRPAGDTATPAVTNPSRGREGRLVLRDGRTLGFAEYGDPDGSPVLFFHSIVGSRFQIHPDREQVDGTGIRWIVPERPGFGLSDPLPGRRLLQWADDVEQLLDHLDLDRVHLAGYSAGGSHALACLWRLPSRFVHTALISPMAPFDKLSALAGMPPTNRMLMAMARYTPALLNPFLRVMLQGLIRNPEQITSRHVELWPQADREAVDTPGTKEHMVTVFREAIRQGPDALVTEQILLAGDWGFDPAEVEVPVDLWHGEADIHVPFSMLEPLRRIPRLRLHAVPGRGHYLLLSHWREIFSQLLSFPAPSPAPAT